MVIAEKNGVLMLSASIYCSVQKEGVSIRMDLILSSLVGWYSKPAARTAVVQECYSRVRSVCGNVNSGENAPALTSP